MQFGIYILCLEFFLKLAVVSDVFKVMGRSFHNIGAATENARLPNLSFVLGTRRCCEIDDLSCLGIFREEALYHFHIVLFTLCGDYKQQMLSFTLNLTKNEN